MNAETAEHRLFFAVQLDAPAALRARRLAQALADRHRLGGRPVSPERLHVSLASIGRSRSAPPEDVIGLAMRLADQVALRPFAAAFNRVQSWRRSNGPLVLVGDEGMIGLERLHDALAELRGRPRAPGFVPHVSLIWGADFLAERLVEPFNWMVREFVLIHSVHGQGRHEVLGRWALGVEERRMRLLSGFSGASSELPIPPRV